MDIKLIKQVVDLMKRSDISEFEFEEDGFKLRLSSKGTDAPQVIHAAPAAQTTAPFPVAAPATGEAVAVAGPTSIVTGTSTAGMAGSVSFGACAGTTHGGDATIVAGESAISVGGDATLSAGSATSTGGSVSAGAAGAMTPS